MNLAQLTYLNIIVAGCLAKLATSADVTLDLKQSQSDQLVEVVASDHFGLASVEFYVKEGNRAVKVVQGDLPVWENKASEYTNEAVLYFIHDPLSLLYLKVYKPEPVYKYFIKITNKWNEVEETAFNLFIEVDRSAYTEEQLNDFAQEYLSNYTKQLVSFSFFLPQSYTFVVEPQYECVLDIDQPNISFIMEQSIVGPCFGKLFTPRTDFAITRVSYKNKDLWDAGNGRTFCSSVWMYRKGVFDTIFSLNMYDFNTGAYSHLLLKQTKDDLVEISFKEFESSLLTMVLAEYDEKDIACYKDGFLRARDAAPALKTALALLVASIAVCYSF